MTEKDIRDYLQDMFNYASNAVEYTHGMTYKGFADDKKTIDAVVRSLEVVGEAARHISTSFREKHATIPWKRITGMRDKLIHDYTGVDLETVWKTATKFAPELKKELEKIL